MSSTRDTLKPGVYLLAVDTPPRDPKGSTSGFCQYVDPGDFAFILHPIGQEVLR